MEVVPAGGRFTAGELEVSKKAPVTGASPAGTSMSSIDTPVATGERGMTIESVVKVGSKVVSGTFVKRSLVASWGWAATRDVESIPLTKAESLLIRSTRERLLPA